MTRITCNCKICQLACLRKPGLFAYEQISVVADFLNISELKLFQNYLGIEWLSLNGPMTLALAPATVLMDSGKFYGIINIGPCVFFEDGRCKIHEVAPYECQNYVHGMSAEEVMRFRSNLLKSWGGKQDYIIDLYGGEPPVYVTFFMENEK